MYQNFRRSCLRIKKRKKGRKIRSISDKKNMWARMFFQNWNSAVAIFNEDIFITKIKFSRIVLYILSNVLRLLDQKVVAFDCSCHKDLEYSLLCMILKIWASSNQKALSVYMKVEYEYPPPPKKKKCRGNHLLQLNNEEVTGHVEVF